MGSYTVTRSTFIAAPPERVRELVLDLREWQKWSPWEGLDPKLKRTYTVGVGVGQHYGWAGNKKAGEGTMDVAAVTDDEVSIDVTFLKPFKSRSTSNFKITPDGSGTEVVWTMTGQQNPILSVVGKMYPMDKMLGPDFEKGLAQLKSTAEAA